MFRASTANLQDTARGESSRGNESAVREGLDFLPLVINRAAREAESRARLFTSVQETAQRRSLALLTPLSYPNQGGEERKGTRMNTRNGPPFTPPADPEPERGGTPGRKGDD